MHRSPSPDLEERFFQSTSHPKEGWPDAADDTLGQAGLPAFSRMIRRQKNPFMKLWEAALRWQKGDNFVIIS